MAKKNITINVDDAQLEITIRRVKKREFKEIVRAFAGKGDELAELLSQPNFLRLIPKAIEDNIDFVCETLITPYATVTNEQLDEMDMVDVVNLLKELLAYNNLDIEKIKDFLRPDPATRRAIRQVLNFDGVPQVLSS